MFLKREKTTDTGINDARTTTQQGAQERPDGLRRIRLLSGRYSVFIFMTTLKNKF